MNTKDILKEAEWITAITEQANLTPMKMKYRAPIS